MKLIEITRIKMPLKSSGINSNADFSEKKKIGEIFENGVFKSISLSNSNIYLFTLERDDIIICSIVAQDNIKIYNENYLMLRRAWTEPEFRGKGFAINLIRFIRNWSKKKLLSDQEHTDDGIKIWNSLIKRFSVTALDVNTGNRISAENLSSDEIYKEDLVDPNNKYFLVLEGEMSPVQKVVRRYSVSSFILKPYEF